MIGNYIEKAYRQLFGALRLESASFVKEIDFDEPWWKIITQFKWKLSGVLVLRGVFEVVNTLIPLFVAWAISTAEFSNYLWVIAAMAFLAVEGIIMEYLYAGALSSVISSLSASCNKFFLSVDPIHHTTRSSGQIISKVTRGSSSYEPLLDIGIYDLWRTIMGILTVTIALGVISPLLGVTAGILMLIILSLGVLNSTMIVKQIAQFRIKEEDALKAVTIENLQEVLLIRSTFATDIQIHKAYSQANQVARHQVNSWTFHTLVFQVSWIVYVVALTVIGYLIFELLGQGVIESITAIALLTTFVDGSARLLFTARRLGRFVEKMNDIQDMFRFIREFGNQSFPVTEKTQSTTL